VLGRRCHWPGKRFGTLQAVSAPFPGVPDGIVGQILVQAASGTTMDIPDPASKTRTFLWQAVESPN
jgi:hypothetical protein